MGIYNVTVPQMGEGLQEARLVRLLKQPGEVVARDEPIFEMETDKATMEIESPVAGTLIEWLVTENSVVAIGAVVGRIEAEGTDVPASVGRPERESGRVGAAPVPAGATASARNALIPPRTRAYARECGVSDAELVDLADRLGTRVMPADVDRYVAEQRPKGVVPASPAATQDLVPLSPSQRTLVYRMQQRAGEVIPATEETVLAWSPVDAARTSLKRQARINGLPVPTPFLLVAWCVVRAAARFPVLRCSYAGEGMLRRHPHLNLGLAVARGEDELLTATIEAADTLSFREFVLTAVDAVKRARAGEDQANSSIQFTLSNLAGHDIMRATPVIVAPAIATLFVGSVHLAPFARDNGSVSFERCATATLTFDHRVMNGVGAASFLSELRRQVEALPTASLAL